MKAPRQQNFVGDGPADAVASLEHPASRGTGSVVADLISVARPDQWTKHIFIVPGLLAGLALGNGHLTSGVAIRIALGFVAACLVASANYVLNEWLDADFDRHHPLKGARPAAQGRLSVRAIYIEYSLLAAAGLAVGAAVSISFLVTCALFLVSGIAYNVPPLRTKERVHLDILSEAINNPLRLLLGWFMISPASVPPLSLLLLYWCGGAFLMGTKRLAEYRYLVDKGGPDLAGRYRKSFQAYDQTLLLMTCFFYGTLSSFFLAVFLVKYRTELLLSVPLFAWLFARYLYLALGEASDAQTQESFYRQPGLMPILAALIIAVAILSVVDIPLLERLIQSRFTIIDLSR